MERLRAEAEKRKKATQVKDGKPPTVTEIIPGPEKDEAREQAAKLFQTNRQHISDAKA
jgi:hypothetical protein